MLDRLVSMRIVTHVHDLHLADLMYHETVVAFVEMRRHGEDAVESLRELVLASHKGHKSLYIMEYRPCIMKRVTLGKVAAPLKRAERTTEIAVLLAAVHETELSIIQIPVIQRIGLVLRELLLRLSESEAELPYAPVVVRILEGTRRTLVDSDVARYISEPVVVVETPASRRLDGRML